MVNKNYIVMAVMVLSIIACSEKEQEEPSKFESNPITESVGSTGSDTTAPATQEEVKMTYDECLAKNTEDERFTFTAEVLCSEYK